MDISLYYEEKGAGFPLILLHGNGESHEYFEHQTAYFAGEFRVIAPDTRGHGRSPRGGGEFSICRFAEDLHDFLGELGIGRAHLLGFSDGGNIALCYALKYPDTVEKLILNGANLTPAGIRRRTQIPIELGYRIARRFSARSPEAKKNAEMLGLMVNEPDILPESLSALRMPTLVIAGTHDMVKRSHTEEIARNIPGAQLVFLPGNHFIAHEKPEIFNRAVADFLHGI